MYRLSFATVLLLAASLTLATACKPKDTADTAVEEETPQDTSVDGSDDAPADTDEADTDDDAADADEPTVILNAPEGGLLGDQGLKNPQDSGTDDSADEGGLKLQLGGGSGYGYQRTQPSLLDN